MAGQNDFLIFDENKDNMLTQELYSVDGDRTDGFKKGLARSNVNNKVLHQTSKMCSAIGELIKGYDGTATDGGTLTELVDNVNGLFIFKPFVKSANFKKGDYVVGTVNENIYIAKSLSDNNTGHDITDINYWEKVSLGGTSLPLFMPQWADHELDNTSFLRADTFSWHNGTTYSNGYNELLSEYNNSASTTKTDTIGTVTVTYKLTPKGYKICAANQVTNLTTLYNNIGIAWYYVLDTANKQFKLPRTKWGFKGLRDNVGNIIAESLPNIKGSWTGAECFTVPQKGTGAITWINAGGGYSGGGGGAQGSGFDFDASLSSSIYQDGAHVQEQGTQMYLYFYIGQYTPEAVEQTAGLNAELFNNKMDRDLSNRTINIHFVTQTYQNGTSWYRIYDDNWCEQGGIATLKSSQTLAITLMKAYTNTNYSILQSMYTTNNIDVWGYGNKVAAVKTSSFSLYNNSSTSGKICWRTSGYIA